METEEKLQLICSLLKEVSIEFKDKANEIKEFDDALYRMLTEDGEYYFHQIYKKIYISGDLDTFITRLKYADKLLVEQKEREKFIKGIELGYYKKEDLVYTIQ